MLLSCIVLPPGLAATAELPDIPAITGGEGEEGVLSAEEQFGNGFVDMKGEGELDPDNVVIVAKSVRPVGAYIIVNIPHPETHKPDNVVA